LRMVRGLVRTGLVAWASAATGALLEFFSLPQP
jgi:hypothetical protein